MANQNPEKIAKYYIDKQLHACDWQIQDKSKLNLGVLIKVPVSDFQYNVDIAYVINNLYLNWIDLDLSPFNVNGSSTRMLTFLVRKQMNFLLN